MDDALVTRRIFFVVPMTHHAFLASMLFRRSRRGMARGVAWLVVAALLSLLTMPMVGVVDPADGFGTSLCASGATSPDATAPSVPASKPHAGAVCPFCLAHAGGFTLPSPVAALSTPLLFPKALHPVLLVGVTPKAFFQTGCQSRAPPHLTA
jgi:hypothetical protein